MSGEALVNMDEAGPEVIKAGWMTKQGGGVRTPVRNWKRRWFVMKDDDTLTYYEDESLESPKGVINLAEVATVGEATTSDRPNTLQLKAAERVYFMQAESKEDMKDWIAVLADDSDDESDDDGSEDPFEVRVKGWFCVIGSMKSSKIFIWPADPVANAKRRIAQKYGWSVFDAFPLYHNGKALPDNKYIGHLGIKTGDTLSVGLVPKSVVGFLVGVLILAMGAAMFVQTGSVSTSGLFGGAGFLICLKFLFFGQASNPWHYIYGSPVKPMDAPRSHKDRAVASGDDVRRESDGRRRSAGRRGTAQKASSPPPNEEPTTPVNPEAEGGDDEE